MRAIISATVAAPASTTTLSVSGSVNGSIGGPSRLPVTVSSRIVTAPIDTPAITPRVMLLCPQRSSTGSKGRKTGPRCSVVSGLSTATRNQTAPIAVVQVTTERIEGAGECVEAMMREPP